MTTYINRLRALFRQARHIGALRRLTPAMLGLAFLVPASAASAATLVLTTTPPTPGPDDVYNLGGADSDSSNVNGGADAYTYVAFDQTGQGQTFTTGNSSGGYLLTDIWIRHCGYTNVAPGNGTWWNWGNGAVVTLRVTDPSKVNLAGFAISMETYTITGTENGGLQWSGGGNSLGDDMWLHFTLATPVSLAPGTQYGLDLTATVNGGGNYFEWLGTSNNVYGGGFAYSGTAVHTPANTIHTNTGDRVFLVQLGHAVPAVPPQLTSPLRYGPVGQLVNVTATIPSIANADRSVDLVLTNNNPTLISLPGGASTLTLNFAAGATNAQSFNVRILAGGVGSISVVTNAAFTGASILIGTPVLAQEEFQYDPAVQPVLDGANGGSGFGAPWYQPTLIDFISSGLTYGAGQASLVTSSNAVGVSGAGNEAFRALPATYGGVGGGTVWISFLVQASSSLFTWGGVSLWSGTNSENLFLGEVVANSPNNTWGFSQGGNYYMYFPGSMTPGPQVDFLVYRIDFPTTNGGQALVSFYADPTLNDTAPYSPLGSAYVNNFTFDTIRLGTGDFLTFDEIRIGSGWTNVMQFTGTAQPLVPPVPTLSTPARFAPVGYAAAVTVSIPANAPRPVTMDITNDNPTAFSLSSSNAAATSLTFPPGGTNVQTLNVQVLGGGSANLTVISNATINSASITIGAQVSASEPFRYDAGSEVLPGSAGGTGFDVNTWTGGGSVISPGLVYPGLSSSGNAASLTIETANRILFPASGNYGGAGGGTVWISFLVRGPVPSDVANSAGMNLLSGGTVGVLLGLNTYQGGSTWGWAGQGQGPVSLPNATAPSTNVDLLVYRLDFPETAGDLVNVTLWVDPAIGSTPPAPTGNGAVHYFTFDTIGITSSVTNDFDEIRLGGSWADVVPTMALSIQAVSATQVRISWPAALTGVALQSTTNLTSGWVPAGLSESTVNGQSVATDTITGGTKFYRLSQ